MLICWMLVVSGIVVSYMRVAGIINNRTRSTDVRCTSSTIECGVRVYRTADLRKHGRITTAVGLRACIPGINSRLYY